MNEIVSRMISTQALLFIYMIVGFIACRAGMIREDNRAVLVRLLMDIAMPMMVLNAFNKVTTAEELRASLAVVAMSGLGCAVTGLLGRAIWRREPENRRKVLMYASMFSNMGNAGLPVVNLVFGPEGVFLASMYLLIPRVLQWTVGLGFFIRPQKGSFVKNVLLNPMVIVVYIGFFIMATGLTIPGVFASAVSHLGDMTGPLSMILIGAALGTMAPRDLVRADVLGISLLRLIVFPLGMALLMRLIGIESQALHICTVLLAMPVASNTAAIAERYGGDYRFASACVSVSTLLSVLTVPAITWVMTSI